APRQYHSPWLISRRNVGPALRGADLDGEVSERNGRAWDSRRCGLCCGSSVITNRPLVMRTGPLGSWFASLYGFFNHIMNRQYELAWKAGDTLDLVKKGEYKKAMAEVPGIAGMLFSYVIAPAIIEELVTPLASDKK